MLKQLRYPRRRSSRGSTPCTSASCAVPTLGLRAECATPRRRSIAVGDRCMPTESRVSMQHEPDVDLVAGSYGGRDGEGCAVIGAGKAEAEASAPLAPMRGLLRWVSTLRPWRRTP